MYVGGNMNYIGSKFSILSYIDEVVEDVVKEKKNIITETCEKNLSKFSVPREIEFLDELPHTPLEKVDFMALEKKAAQ